MTDRSTQLDGPEDSDDDTFDQIKCLWISVISMCLDSDCETDVGLVPDILVA